MTATILSVEEIRERLKLSKLSKVAAEAGVSSASVYRLMNGSNKPYYETVKALSDFLQKKEPSE